MDSFENDLEIPESLPLLPVRDIAIFPYMVLPLFVGRDSSIAAVDEALNKDRFIFLVAQKNAELEEPEKEDLYNVGTVCLILRMLKQPDGRVKILVQGLKRAKIEEFVENEKFFKVNIKVIEDEEFEVYINN